MIALGTDPLGGRFGQGCIGLKRFMEAFDFPPFLVDRLDAEGLPIEIATGQIKGARTPVFVCKDLAVQQDGKIQSFDPAELGDFFRFGPFGFDFEDSAFGLTYVPEGAQ